ncbi:MAG TPA: hypothetical protein VFT01_01120, partial [Homoserinimonas sp.]|nr:hypothetical protein [Homoserinimonas sp.]
MPDSRPRLREVGDADLPQALEIYNHYVLTSTVTFDEQPLTLAAFQAKVSQIAELGFPFIVAEGAP